MKTTYDRLVEQGLEKGRAEGRAEMLLRQLTERFGVPPAHVEERVRTATVEQLDLWAVAVLTADKLEDVFTAG